MDIFFLIPSQVSVMLTALSERWHEETCNFHLSAGETVTLDDDVECPLDISIVGRMMRHEKYTSHAYGVELMTGLLGVDETKN